MVLVHRAVSVFRGTKELREPTGWKWYDAITARKNGTATQEQIELLDKGDWKEINSGKYPVAAMLWYIMYLLSYIDTSGILQRVTLVQGRRFMSIEVVYCKNDFSPKLRKCIISSLEREGAVQAPFLVGRCDKEERLTKESYHSDSVDVAESYQYNERNELTKRTVTGDTASAVQSISQKRTGRYKTATGMTHSDFYWKVGGYRKRKILIVQTD